jgi:hypothetical protein
MTFGAFIEPDAELADLADPNEKLGIPIYSGHKAIRHSGNLAGRSRIFDALAAQLKQFRVSYEDQCSAQYYFDLVTTLRDFNGEFDRLVEVGVYMGGSSAIFGGCLERFDYDLDLVDIDARFLRFAHERIRRLFPEAIGRVRLFHGDLPSYVRNVLMHEEARCVVHHDGAHDFNQVVKDFASLSYVKEKLHAVIAQDTHLRGTLDNMNFVDMALYAVFGLDLNYAPIGAVYEEWDGRTEPNQYQGNYFVPGQHEGFVLPMAMNEFRYPHPSIKLEALLQEAA